MLLGPPMPGSVPGWRFVESDLHDIAGRVTEYDRDARLVRNDDTGQLALARRHRSEVDGGRWRWLLARSLHDLDTDRPLIGEPDGRVLRCQRATDSWGRDLADWRRRVARAERARERREYEAMHDENMLYAERFVHELRHDVSARPRAYIPKGIPA